MDVRRIHGNPAVSMAAIVTFLALAIPAFWIRAQSPEAALRGSGPGGRPAPGEGMAPESQKEEADLSLEAATPSNAQEAVREAGGDSILVTGEVLDADSGGGIPGVEVWMTPGVTSITVARTGAEGRFTARVMQRRGNRLAVSVRDPRFYVIDQALVPAHQESREVFVRILVRSWKLLTLEVMNAAGAPLPGADVDWMFVGARAAKPGVSRTNAMGCVEIPLEDGQFYASAIAPGCGRGFHGPQPARREGSALEAAEIALPEAAPVVGRVVDSGGAGVPGLKLAFVLAGGSFLRLCPSLAGRLVDDRVTTESGGEFVLRSVTPGATYRVRILPGSRGGWGIEGGTLRIDGSSLLLRAVRR